MSKKKNKNRAVKGTITILSTLLFGSALLRGALTATEVLAESQNSESLPKQMEADEPIETTSPSELIQALLRREKSVHEREGEVAIQTEALKVARFEVERRLVALEEAETRLSATFSKASVAAETDVNQLIQVYENMKPKELAALFETMEPAFAAGFLGRMRPEAAAGVMAGLSPKIAYTISVILAGRNANAPKR